MDPEFVETILQVIRYDFNVPRARALDILIRLNEFNSLRETATAALISVISSHERLSSPFLMVAQELEHQVDCASLNICRDVLESEITPEPSPTGIRWMVALWCLKLPCPWRICSSCTRGQSK